MRIDQYPVASELVNTLMTEVRARVLGNETLKKKLFQVNFHTTRDEAMVTLIYHKKLDESWTAEATRFRDELTAALGDRVRAFHVIGRSRKQKVCLDADHVVEVYDVKGRGELSYVQVEGAFSQPNSGRAHTCCPGPCRRLRIAKITIYWSSIAETGILRRRLHPISARWWRQR